MDQVKASGPAEDGPAGYQTLVKSLLSGLAELVNCRPPAHGAVETLCAFDDDRGQYLLLKTGWVGDRRVRGTTLYLRLRGGKVWVEEDWTEDGIAAELLKAGVPREDIVLAFHPPRSRPLTEFATA